MFLSNLVIHCSWLSNVCNVIHVLKRIQISCTLKFTHLPATCRNEEGETGGWAFTGINAYKCCLWVKTSCSAIPKPPKYKARSLNSRKKGNCCNAWHYRTRSVCFSPKQNEQPLLSLLKEKKKTKPLNQRKLWPGSCPSPGERVCFDGGRGCR